MHLQNAIQQVFQQLNNSLVALSDEQYTKPCARILHATIGQHVRHIIELFICLEKGYQQGAVNYEKRKRDLLIETDKQFASELLLGIETGIHKPDKTLFLEANYDADTDDNFLIPTNYYREVLYNLEHTVHHMALIRVGINEVSAIELPRDFGVAASTIKHKKACAQ